MTRPPVATARIEMSALDTPRAGSLRQADNRTYLISFINPVTGELLDSIVANPEMVATAMMQLIRDLRARHHLLRTIVVDHFTYTDCLPHFTFHLGLEIVFECATDHAARHGWHDLTGGASP